MEREIKFRAWVTTGLGLVEEYFMSYNITDINFAQGSPEGSNIKRGNPIKLRINNDPAKTFGMHLDSKEPVVLMQYTGLKDKNGVEIYEGDIVVTDVDVNAVKKGWLFTVEWTTGIGVGLKLYGVGKYINNHPVDYMDLVDTYFNDQDSEIFEVIGNVYENGDLLKEQPTDERS